MIVFSRWAIVMTVVYILQQIRLWTHCGSCAEWVSQSFRRCWQWPRPWEALWVGAICELMYNESAGHAYKLLLPKGEVGAWIINLTINLFAQISGFLWFFANLVPKRNLFESLRDLLISVFIEGIDVGLDCACKKSRILRNNGNILPKVMQAQLWDIFSIKINASNRAVLIFSQF